MKNLLSNTYPGNWLKHTLLSVTLVACGGGGSGGDTPEGVTVTDKEQSQTIESTDRSISVKGGGVKGPMSFAAVSAYAFDGGKKGYQGDLIDTAETDAIAALSGLTLRSCEASSLPITLNINSDGDTIDLSTGLSPQAPGSITKLRTVISSDTCQLILNDDQPVYATPLTTLAVDLAIHKTREIADVNAKEFEEMLLVAAKDVVTALGYGLSPDIDIFLAAPLINENTVNDVALTTVAEYRMAIEAVGALVMEMYTRAAVNDSDANSDAILHALAVDLSDGIIDGQDGNNPIAALRGIIDIATVLSLDPLTLYVPGREDVLVSDVEYLLIEDMVRMGGTVNVDSLIKGTINVTPSQIHLNIRED